MCVSSKLQCYISHRCDSTCTHVSNEHSFVKSIVESSPRILRSNDATVRLARCVSDGWLDRPKKSARPIREINACGGGFFFLFNLIVIRWKVRRSNFHSRQKQHAGVFRAHISRQSFPRRSVAAHRREYLGAGRQERCTHQI